MRRALFALLVAVLLSPTVATATHIELPSFAADCNRFDFAFRAQWRSTLIEAELQLVVTIVDEAGDEQLRFEHAEMLPYNGESEQYFSFGWLWNDVTDETIPLYGAQIVTIVATIVAPYGDHDQVDIHTVELQDIMACDVVSDESHSWGGIKSLYR